MFGENLLESSPGFRRRSGWPMAAAFSLETMALGVLLSVPLLFTGIIPVSAHAPIVAPITSIKVDDQPATARGGKSHGPAADSVPVVALLNTNRLAIARDRDIVVPVAPRIGDDFDNTRISDVVTSTNRRNCECVPSGEPIHQGPVSVLSPGELLKKIEPVYPHIAVATGVSGEVRLHAIISREGKIEQLTVVSGHPLLVPAAEEAVKQWVYRPYILNGQKVEVETLIVVNFKKTGT